MAEHHHREPTLAEIERAWTRPRTTRTASSYGRWVHRYQRAVWRLMTVLLVLWFVVVALLTATAAVDVIAGLGWGYEARDVVGHLLVLGMGGLFVPFFWGVKTVVSALTQRIYGVEPSDARENLN